MQLAKSVIDIGLSTNNLEPMLQFWQQDAAVRFDHVLPVRRGQKQYRHDEQGSVIKLNHHAEPLPEAAPATANCGWLSRRPNRQKVDNSLSHHRLHGQALAKAQTSTKVNASSGQSRRVSDGLRAGSLFSAISR